MKNLTVKKVLKVVMWSVYISLALWFITSWLEIANNNMTPNYTYSSMNLIVGLLKMFP